MTVKCLRRWLSKVSEAVLKVKMDVKKPTWFILEIRKSAVPYEP